METKVTQGRFVSFNTGSGQREVALVTSVGSGNKVNLFVWNRDGVTRTEHQIDQGTVAGTWAWPEGTREASATADLGGSTQPLGEQPTEEG